jgi:hypothetical protein
VKSFIFRNWFVLWFLVAAAVTLVSVPAFASDHWFPSKVRKPAITKAEVFEVAKFDARCSLLYTNNLRGCYIPETCDMAYPNMAIFCTPGRIEIAKFMPPWLKECVIEHERKHERGEDHTHGWSDC